MAGGKHNAMRYYIILLNSTYPLAVFIVWFHIIHYIVDALF